jgi:tetratricopeptide (TPR) repeat protein
MPRDRLPFRLILILGLTAAVAWHARGAIDAADALHAAALHSGVLTGRLLGLGADLIRLVDTRFDPFQALHLAAGVMLAVAAALSTAVASRRADHTGGAGLAAGLFVGGAVLLGGDLGAAGRSAAPIAVLLALLAGSLWCWTRDPARPLTGGLLAGLAVAGHPYVLVLLPGLLLAAGRSGGLPRAAAGLVLGSLALHLPPPGGEYGGAIAAWWSSGWAGLAPVSAWGGQAADFGGALLRNAGPVGIVLGAVAVFTLRATEAPLSRAAIVLAVLPALACLLGRPADAADARVLHALTAWAFLFWSAPGIAAVARRLPAALVPAIAAAALIGLFIANRDALDQSAEPTTAWAAQTLKTLPENALLLADNPVHFALAQLGGLREGQQVEFVRPENAGRLRERVIQELGAAAERPVLIDAALFFNPARRTAVLGETVRVHPNGLAFLMRPHNAASPTLERNYWEGSRPDDESPRSPLRGGLTVREYFGRGLVQSGYLHAEARRSEEAEREFLFALSLGEPNPTLAALGLARIQIQARNRKEAIHTLEDFTRAEDEGAWAALELLADSYRQEGRTEEAVTTYRRAFARCPTAQAADRERIDGKITRTEAAAAEG